MRLERAEHLDRMQFAWRLRSSVSHDAGRSVSSARTSAYHAVARHVLPAARRISASPAGRVSATQPKATRSPLSRTARSTNAASGSMTTQRQAASTAGGSPNFSVKSKALPSSTIRSARRIASTNAPSVASLKPRGLSMIAVGMRVASSMRASRSRPVRFAIAGPASRNGRCAAATMPRIASAAASFSVTGDAANAPGSGHTTSAAATVASSRSDGRLRCTGPGLPERAMRIAFATSAPSVAVAFAVHDAFAIGAATSA